MLLAVAGLLLLLLGIGLVRLRIPPRAARLLPECDAIVFANLAPVRQVTHFQDKPVPHSADYQKFIDATGIVLERDLNQVAFALTRMPNPSGPNGPVAFSEVMVGRFDAGRLKTYLQSVAGSQESYAGHDIFLIPVDLPSGPASHMVPTGRTLRVSQLSEDTIVASNAPTPEQIHAMLDKSRSVSSPFSGPTLLSGLYSEVPLFSSFWGIGALGLPFADNGRVTAFGLHLPLADTTPFIASLRYTTGLKLRIEQIAGSEAEAARSAERLTTLLVLFQQMQKLQSLGPHEAVLTDSLNSIKITQRRDRTILTADIPLDLLRTLATPR